MLFLVSLISCENDAKSSSETTVLFSDQSVTPVLLKKQAGFDLELSLIASDDVLAGSPILFFGGSADGSGLLRNADGTLFGESTKTILQYQGNF
jgi:hypothetical protein